MKYIISLFCIAILCIVTGCKKKKNECWMNYWHIPMKLSFAGFTAAEVDSIYVDQYEANGLFDKFVRKDTLYYARFAILHDTLIGDSVIYSTNNLHAGVRGEWDYEIFFSGIDRKFRIAGITYPSEERWTQEERCPNGHYSFAYPDKMRVNGKAEERFNYIPPDSSYAPYTPQYFILRK